MADIELIPADYARARALRRQLLHAGLVLAMIVGAAMAARGWLAWRLATERPLVQHLTARETAVKQQVQRLDSLRAEVAVAKARVSALAALQDGAAGLALATAVDRAWTPRIWLAGTSQQRELSVPGPVASTPSVPAVPAPPGTAAAAEPPHAQVRNRFEIEGHGLDHSAVTDFLRTLSTQPGLAGVRLDETGLRRLGTVDVVDFRLSGVIHMAAPARLTPPATPAAASGVQP